MRIVATVLLAVSLLASGINVSTEPAVSRHFSVLANQAKALSASVGSFSDSGETVKQVEVIHSEVTSLINLFRNGTTLVPNAKFSKVDSLTILSDVKDFQPILINAFKAILEKKPALKETASAAPQIWEALAADVQQLGDASQTLGSTLLAAADPDVFSQASAVCFPVVPLAANPDQMSALHDALANFPN